MKGNSGMKGSEKSETAVIVHTNNRRGISITNRRWLLLQMTCVAAIVFYLYCHDESNLHGEWILDDKVSILMNPLVSGELSWAEIWNRDFWGKDILTLARSHKSWRPLCTATYRLNYIWANGLVTYWFHLVDRILYALVAALVVPVSAYTFLHYTNTWKQQSQPSNSGVGSNPALFFVSDFYNPTCFYTAMTLASFFYAAHPIHVESVANSTGRAEVLCGFFYFVGFLIYARVGAQVSLLQNSSSSEPTSTVGWLGIIGMILCTLAAMLSKEHGITLPIVCIAWDALIGTDTSIPELLRLFLKRNNTNASGSNGMAGCPSCFFGKTISCDCQRRMVARSTARERKCINFLIRSFVGIFFMFYIAVWRIDKNGSYSTDFVCEQNQGACLSHPIIKFIHLSFLWCFNFWLLLNPRNLSADWTADAVPMLDDPWTDPRLLAVLCLWSIMIFALYHIFGAAFDTQVNVTASEDTLVQKSRRTLVVSFLWMLIPFLMSSNLFVYVGLTIADRTLFLPSFGFCLLLVQGLSVFSHMLLVQDSIGLKNVQMSTFALTLTKNASVILLAFYVAKQQSYTKLWSKTEWIWCESNRVAPGSIMAERECGLALVNAGYAKLSAIKLTNSLQRAMKYPLGTKTARDSSSKIVRSISEQKQQEWTHTKSLMQTRFIATHSMVHSGQCKEALPLIDEGINIIDDILQTLAVELSTRDHGNDFERTRFYTFPEIQLGISTEKAALLVTKSKCAPHLESMAQISFQALEARGDNENVIDHIRKVTDLVERAKMAKKDPKDIRLVWVPTETGYDLTFA